MGSIHRLNSVGKLEKAEVSVHRIWCRGSGYIKFCILKNLIVLYIENFKRIEDYSPLTALEKLEQLVISGPTLGYTPIKDLEFLYEMRSLVSIWLPNTTIRIKYTSEQLENLRISLPNLYPVCDCIWGSKKSR